MVVKVYISGISGNKEVKKRQQRVSMILDSKSIKYEIIDITEPGREADKDFMQNNSKSNGGTVSDPNPRSPLPPQLFNDEEYCGDYDQFDLANEIDTLEQFLKVEAPPEVPQPENDKEKAVNGDVLEENEASKDNSQSDTTDAEKPVVNDESVKKQTPVKEETSGKEESPAKEGTPLRESSSEPIEATNENDEQAKGDPPKETTPERQKSVEKEVTEKAESPAKEVESKDSKEHSPEKEESVNANGTVSSRDQSAEKDAAIDEPTVERKKDPSEALIQSEQTAADE